MKISNIILLFAVLFSSYGTQAQPGGELRDIFRLYIKAPSHYNSVTIFIEYPVKITADLAQGIDFLGDSIDKIWKIYLIYHDYNNDNVRSVMQDKRPIRLYVKLGDDKRLCEYCIMRPQLPTLVGPNYEHSRGYIGEAVPGTRVLLCFPDTLTQVPKLTWRSVYRNIVQTPGYTREDEGTLPDLRPYLRTVPPEYDDRTSAVRYCSPEWGRPVVYTSPKKKIHPRYLREKDGITRYDPYAPMPAPPPQKKANSSERRRKKPPTRKR